MRPYRKLSHSVHDLKVHLIWITKYRYKVPGKDVSIRIRDIIRQVCDSKDIQIIKGNTNVHITVAVEPRDSQERKDFFPRRESQSALTLLIGGA